MNKRYILEVMAERLPMEDESRAIMDREDYREYISTHGYHFSDRLSELASGMLVNADGTIHRWSVDEAEDALSPLPGGWTRGDASYVLNLLYSDLHCQNGIPTESGIVEYSKRYMKDPDGYEGMAFMRWIGDLIGKSEEVNWMKYI